MKRVTFIFCGVCWLGFAVMVSIIAWPYLAAGGVGDSGFILQIFEAVTPASVLLGLVHSIGIIWLVLVCLGIGFNLLLNGLFPKQNRDRVSNPPKQL